MPKQKNNMRRVDDLTFDTSKRWKRIRLTIIELATVVAVIFIFCYALHLVEGVA